MATGMPRVAAEATISGSVSAMRLGQVGAGGLAEATPWSIVISSEIAVSAAIGTSGSSTAWLPICTR